MAGRWDGAGSGVVPAWIGKVDAVEDLAARAGLAEVDASGPAVAGTIAAIGRALRRLSNPHVELRDAATLHEARTRLEFGERIRALPAPLHLTGLPPGFTAGSATAHSPEFRVLEVPDAYLCHYPDVPMVVAPAGDVILRDAGSRFAGLVHYYETSLRQMLADAVRIDGTVVAIADDVRPLNFCHWIVDWLPRLAFLAEQVRRSDLFVAVPPLGADYQWETLALCGIPRERVVQLGTMQGLQARRLLVPGDLPAPQHPAAKAAAWALDYLRATLGYGAFLAGIDGAPRRRKLYVSRNDAPGRRVLNEADLLTRLAPLGYEPVSLTGMPMLRQIALFAGASHVVALHGAGLTNIVFADPSAMLLELFPSSYGMASYYVLAAGLGVAYASYVCDRVTPGERDQLDDITVDIEDFMMRARHLL